MTNGFFHITVATLVGAMTVAGVAIAMAPPRAGEVAKAAQATAPVTAAIPVAPIAPAQPTVAVEPDAHRVSTEIKDVCIVKALARLPKIDGMRVKQSLYKFYQAKGQEIYGNVVVSIEVHGHQAQYAWMCLADQDSGIVVLVALR